MSVALMVWYNLLKCLTADLCLIADLRRKDVRMSVWMNEWRNERKEQTNERASERMNERTKEIMNEWMSTLRTVVARGNSYHAQLAVESFLQWAVPWAHYRHASREASRQLKQPKKWSLIRWKADISRQEKRPKQSKNRFGNVINTDYCACSSERVSFTF